MTCGSWPARSRHIPEKKTGQHPHANLFKPKIWNQDLVSRIERGLVCWVDIFSRIDSEVCMPYKRIYVRQRQEHFLTIFMLANPTLRFLGSPLPENLPAPHPAPTAIDSPSARNNNLNPDH